jgi:adenylate cyclase class 2
MSRSSREVEVKLGFDSADRALAAITALGALRTSERLFEDNVVYDRERDALVDAGKLLRLRRVGGRSIVTYKEPVAGEHRHKVRGEAEIEIDVPDEFERIAAGLGFRPVYRYQKFRTSFRLGELDLLLDETPVGCFVELEGPPESIDRVARALGRGASDYIVETYREIHERVSRERGVEPGDLVFDPPIDAEHQR